ncbi:MAG: hypothetical protein WAN65_14510 [Candidatus Sulfotelmatobacter sp.]
MKSIQGWGWLAAGGIALGLNGIYHDGGAAWARRNVGQVIERIESRTGPVLAMATGRADWFLTQAKITAAQEQTASCRAATAVARFQTKLARSETGMARIEEMSAREEAAMARIEANRARIEAQVARARFEPAVFDSVVCPRVRVRVPRVQISAPIVHVDLGSM